MEGSSFKISTECYWPDSVAKRSAVLLLCCSSEWAWFSRNYSSPSSCIRVEQPAAFMPESGCFPSQNDLPVNGRIAGQVCSSHHCLYWCFFHCGPHLLKQPAGSSHGRGLLLSWLSTDYEELNCSRGFSVLVIGLFCTKQFCKLAWINN